MKFEILLCSIIFVGATTGNIEYDGRFVIHLYHSFGTNAEFTDRGNLTIQSVRSNLYTLEQNVLNPVEIEKLKNLAKSDGFYQLKSVVHPADGYETTYISSMKASILVETALHDFISIWFLNNGGIASVSISPTNVDSQPMHIDFQQVAIPNKFHTDVFIKHLEPAPIPDTASYIQKLEREREAREKGEMKDNRSFFAKYWMYIVPFVIFILLSGAANPEQPASR